jgi:hypothetical protein
MLGTRDPFSVRAAAKSLHLGGLRAADWDRDAVAELLRAQHLAGRLDHDELELRLGRCLTARTYLELAATIADLPVDQRPAWPPLQLARAPGGTRRRAAAAASAAAKAARPVFRGLAMVIAILMLAIWLLSTAGLPFWPAWVWLGLAIPFSFDAALCWAWRRPPGRRRRAVILWTVVGVVEAILITIWALEWFDVGDMPYFWPAWPLLSVLALAGSYSVVVRESRRAAHSI